MKTIITILLIVVCLSCKAQDPDTIICYSEEDVQVLLADTVTYYEGIIQAFGDVVNSNHHLFFRDTLRIEVYDSAGISIDLIKRGQNIEVVLRDSIDRAVNIYFYPSTARAEYIYKQIPPIRFNIPNHLFEQ